MAEEETTLQGTETIPPETEKPETEEVKKPEAEETPETEQKTGEEAAEGEKKEGEAPEKKKEEPPAEKKEEPVEEKRFEVNLGEETKSFTADELCEFTSDVISQAIQLRERFIQEKQGRLKDPLSAAYRDFLDIFKGDEKQAWSAFVNACQTVYVKEFEYQQLPEAERKALDAERQVKQLQAKMEEAKREQEKGERLDAQIRAAEQFLVDLNSAIQESGVPDTRELRARIIYEMKAHRAQNGSYPSVKDVVNSLKESTATHEEALEEERIKKLPLEKLRKYRPELAKELEKAELEAAKAKREEIKEKDEESESESPGRQSGYKIVSSMDW